MKRIEWGKKKSVSKKNEEHKTMRCETLSATNLVLQPKNSIHFFVPASQLVVLMFKPTTTIPTTTILLQQYFTDDRRIVHAVSESYEH